MQYIQLDQEGLKVRLVCSSQHQAQIARHAHAGKQECTRCVCRGHYYHCLVHYIGKRAGESSWYAAPNIRSKMLSHGLAYT
jgi:hypothetical protein